MKSVTSDHGQLFFNDAPDNTGKTFFINLLSVTIKSFQYSFVEHSSNVDIAVAYSVAVLLQL